MDVVLFTWAFFWFSYQLFFRFFLGHPGAMTNRFSRLLAAFYGFGLKSRALDRRWFWDWFWWPLEFQNWMRTKMRLRNASRLSLRRHLQLKLRTTPCYSGWFMTSILRVVLVMDVVYVLGFDFSWVFVCRRQAKLKDQQCQGLKM